MRLFGRITLQRKIMEELIANAFLDEGIRAFLVFAFILAMLAFIFWLESISTRNSK